MISKFFALIAFAIFMGGCASVNPHWNDPPPHFPSSNWQFFQNGDTIYSK
jgi:hypothetical protein